MPQDPRRAFIFGLISPPPGSAIAQRTGAIRIALGALFALAGINKLVTPKFKEAWHQQIIQTDLPLPETTRRLGPFAELGAAAMLISGYRARLGAASVFAMMAVALHVHRETDAQYLPMENKKPILAIGSMAAAAMVMLHGAGSWTIKTARLQR